MKKIIFLILVIVTVISIMLFNFNSRNDWEVGENGEPPKIHKEDYNSQFTVLYTDYFEAINIFFNFVNNEEFHIIQYGDCFIDVLNYSFNKNDLPCNALYSEKGAPTKNLARFIIKDKQTMGCQLKGPNYINFSIVLTHSGRFKKGKLFKNKYEKLLNKLQIKYSETKNNWNCKKI